MNVATKVKRFFTDGFLSAMTGLGEMGLDKHVSLVPQYTHLDPMMLANLWKGDWVSRKAVMIPAADSTRMWRFWKADKEDIKKLEELERKFNVQQKLLKALTRARLYGGAALIIGVDDGQDVSQELNLKRCKKDCLKYLHVCTRYELETGLIEFDPISPWYGRPKWYRANTYDPENGVDERKKIHPSRVVHLIGNDNCDAFVSMNVNQGWGDSVLQSIYDAISASGSTLQNIAHLIQEAKIDVVRTPALQNQLMDEDSETKFVSRWQETNRGKSLFKMIILDKEEEWQRIGATFTGMPEIMDAMFLVTCAAADIPATRFMGQSPKGLNATGESDLRNYYDRIKSDQEQDMTPSINQLDEVLIRSALGKRSDEVWYEWRSLWQMSEGDKATNDKTIADTVQVYAGTGVIPPTALSKVVVNKLVEMGTFPGLEDAMAEAEAAGDTIEPPPSPEEEAALRVKEEEAMRKLPPSQEAQLKLQGPKGGGVGGGGSPPASVDFEANQLRVDSYANKVKTFKDRRSLELAYLEDAIERVAKGLPFIDLTTFEEHLHPRGGVGSGQGGKFISKGGVKETSAPQEGVGGVGGGGGAASPAGHQAPKGLKGKELEARVQSNVDKGSKAAEARGIKPLEGSKGGHVGQIATRNVTAAGVGKEKEKIEAEKKKFNQPTVEAMKQNPEAFARDMNLFKNTAFYPNFKEEDTKGTPEQVARKVVDHMKENLRFFWNKATDLENDKQWYDGARNIVDKRAEQSGLSDMAVAGVYASLSPQKDWDQNVYLGDRMIAIYTSKIKQSEWTPEMDAKATELGKKPDIKKVIESVRGKQLGELDTPDKKGIWIRVYDEATNTREFAVISSTGEYGEPRKGKTGEMSKAAWQSTPALASAVKSLESGGDREVISEAMGKQHKVRSFYNNILDPHSPNGDVTSDTHHVGAALMRDLGGSTVPVTHNFGNSLDKAQQAEAIAEGKKLSGKEEVKYEPTGKSSTTGLSGTYALYGDATRELAAELKVEPRQLQSVVWTTKRNLFENVTDADHAEIERTWQQYNKGAANLKETQEKVYKTLTTSPQEKEANSLMAMLQNAGGLSYNTKTSSVPQKGFITSPYPEHERVVDAKSLTPADIIKYMDDKADVLKKAGNHLGLWHNKADGKVYFDVTVVKKTAAEAEKLSIKAEQLAYFDLENLKEVSVGTKEGGVYTPLKKQT